MNKNLIYFALVVIAFMALMSVTVPNSASAYYQHNYARYSFNPPAGNDSLYPETANIAYPTNYNSSNNYSYNQNYSSTNNSSQANTSSGIENTRNENVRNEENTAESRVTTTDFKNVTASAIFGSNSFMPSGLVQWLILAIFILLIILFIRRAFGLDQKYHSAPLKHA